MRVLLCVLPLAVLLAACDPRAPKAPKPETKEIAQLRAEVERLRRENADLRISPYQLAAEVDAAIRAADDEKAAAAFKQLNDTFPVASETTEMRRRLEAFQAKRRAEEAEAKRLAALGFKGMPASPSMTHEDMAMTLTSAGFTRRWIFDSYGDGWRFLDAEKDKRMLVARMNVTAKAKESALFGLGAYVADGDRLVRIGSAKYRFARWSSYGAFLGTQPEPRNDFGHSYKVPFTAGVELKEQDLRRGPVYLVATTEGCHQRVFERFGQPQVFYVPGPCETLRSTLKASDFKSGSLVLLKRIDAGS